MKKKILVVDDEQYILEMIQLRLEEVYDVKIASSGEKAFTIALSFKPDLILMDLVLEHGMSGIQSISKIKSEDETKDIPIVVLTGKTLNEDKEESLRAGASEFISKPILPSRLIERIDEILSSPYVK